VPSELNAIRALPDAELVERLNDLAARERAALSDVLAHLAELDTRDVHLSQGYASLFVYCRDALALSEHDAFNRVRAARAARRFPAVLERLREGALNLVSLKMLAPYLTPENVERVLECARGRRRFEIEQIVASLAPWPEVPAFIGGKPAAGGPLPSPVAPGHQLQLTVSAETAEKLRLAKDMLRHAIPSGDGAALFDRALNALLDDLARKKFAATDNPRPQRDTSATSRHVPAQVKRAVWLRDLGRCAFVGDGGRRCGERALLEFHHVRPYAAGGAATVENIGLRCRRHNDYEARAYFRRDEPQGQGPAS
jgi:hypothetical protein